MINVLIVDDSATARGLLKMALETDPEIRVIGMVQDGKEAIDIIPKLRPDIVLMDLRMPNMDGFQAVRHIMGYFATRILIVTASFSDRTHLVFRALEAGALDLIEKPMLGLMENNPDSAKELISKVKTLSKVNIAGIERNLGLKLRRNLRVPNKKSDGKIVAIAVSTGGPRALKEVVPLFPEDLPAGVIIIQHMSRGFISGMADWLQALSRIKIKVAGEGDTINQGEVLFPPDNYHIILDKNGKIRLEDSPPIFGIRPAADILFPTIAKYYGKKVIGVIMTGMGDDGVRGMECIKREGGATIAQDEKSCAVFGMPKVAIERGVIDKIVPLGKITETIIDLL